LATPDGVTPHLAFAKTPIPENPKAPSLLGG
jgi:hypothetical protein